MKKNKDNAQLVKDLEDDIKLYNKTYAIAACKEAADLLTNKAREVILDFYLDYSKSNPKFADEKQVPFVYDRTYDFRDNSYKRYYHNTATKYVYGGVRISADSMQPYKNGKSFIPAEQIIQYQYFTGYHSTTEKYGQYYTKPSPHDALMEYFESDDFKNAWNNAGFEAAKKQTYKYLYRILR